MKRSDVIEYLYKKNFIITKSEKFKIFDEEIVFLQNVKEGISVILKEYRDFNEDKIINDVVSIRAFLKNNGVNIWNSYYLVLNNFDEDYSSKFKFLYNLEKNTLGIRKYVLLEQKDLLRLPFLTRVNTPESNKFNVESRIDEILATEEEKLKIYFEWIFEQNGDFQVLKRNQIKEKVKKTFIEEF